MQRFTAVTMEPRGLLAEWDAAKGHLTVSGMTKVVFHNRRILAKQIGLPEDAITMIEADVGGGFGVRGEFYPEDFLIPFAARKLNRAVKWIEDRRENLIASQPRPRRRMRAGDRLRARRHHPGLARRGRGRSRRLHPHQRRHRGAQHRAGAVRALSRAEHPFRDGAAAHQQDAVGHLSRAGPLRGGFFPRAAVRHGGERSRHRPRRIPPQQSRRRARDAVGACRPCSRSIRAARPTPAITGRRSTAASRISAGRRNPSCKAS